MSCGVGEGDVSVHEGDEATTTPACSVLSECCVSRKFRCMMSLFEFSFLDKCNVYVVVLEDVFEFVYFVRDPINIELKNVQCIYLFN